MEMTPVADKHTLLTSSFFLSLSWSSAERLNLSASIIILPENDLHQSWQSLLSCVWWFSYQFLMQYNMLRAVCQLPCFISIVQLKKHLFEVTVVVFFSFSWIIGFFPEMIFQYHCFGETEKNNGWGKKVVLKYMFITISHTKVPSSICMFVNKYKAEDVQFIKQTKNISKATHLTSCKQQMSFFFMINTFTMH